MALAWTDERIEELRRLWAEGRSASQIAEQLGDGLTRNAVIGKAHRLGLPQRPSPLKPAAAPQPAPQPAEGAGVGRETADEPRPRPKPRMKRARVTLLDLNERVCKWPIGHPDEPDFHFCGQPVNPGFPYCPAHCLEAYQAQIPRRDRNSPPPPFRSGLPRPR